MAEIRIGTCSWPTTRSRSTGIRQASRPGDRLAYYAEHFDTVEVDSDLLPPAGDEMVERWAERTRRIVDALKGLRLMTRHPSSSSRCRRTCATKRRQTSESVERPSRNFAVRSSKILAALEPLRSGGSSADPFPVSSYVVYQGSFARVPAMARRADRRRRDAREFRHASWLDEDQSRRHLAVLEEPAPRTYRRRASDRGCQESHPDGAPRSRARPLTSAFTTATRRPPTWNKRGGGAAERFDYLYSDEELHEGFGRCATSRSRPSRPMRSQQQRDEPGRSRRSRRTTP